jgi:exodeoxyribonuclease VII small subunit
MPSKKTPSKPEPNANDDAGSFELSLHELKKIVTDLEGGELDLTSSLERYEQGIRRLKECHAFLASAEQRVSQLVGFDAEGNPLLAPLEPAASEDLSQKQQARQSRRSASTDTSNAVQRTQERPTSARSKESVDEFPELF